MVTRFQEHFLHHRLPFFDDVRLGRGDGDVEFYMVFFVVCTMRKSRRILKQALTETTSLKDNHPKNVLKSLGAAMNAA